MILKRILAACTFIAAGTLAAAAVNAADYPDRSIRLIVPTATGSTADVVARVVAEGLGNILNQALVVENVAGAAGIPGTRRLVSATPDGYTLAIVSSNHAINPSLQKSMPYDAQKDITPVSIIGTTPLVVVVSEASPYNTIQDLLADARKNPGKINYGSSGTGSVLHLAGELLKSRAQIDMLHIPYKGGNGLITDTMSGQIHTAFLAVPSVLAQVQAGKLKALAVSTPNRLPALPDVPTLAEAGVTDYSYDAWIALIGPAHLPTDITQKLQQSVAQTMASKRVLDSLNPLGFVSMGGSTQEAERTMSEELSKSRTLVENAGINIE